MSKRSSRLNNCDLSTKAVSGKTLRSRKIITVNEGPLRTEVATRKKKLYVVIKDVSPKKYRSGKSSNNSSNDELYKKKKIEKSTKEEQEEKKTRKKKNIVISSSLNKNKHKISINKKKVTNRPIEQHQMTLQESFKRQSMKYLRPRQKKINYCDDSKLLQQHLPSQHQDSVVILERLDSNDIKKIPVYKTIKTSEQSSENKNDVYDFKYDTNDRKEKLVKKKKKKNIKTKSRVIKKSVRKKVTVETKLVDKKTGKSSDADKDIEIVRCKSPLEPAAASPLPPESIEENPLDMMKISKVDTDAQMIGQTSLSNKPSIEQIKKIDSNKPRIVSVENATNIIITKAPPGSAKDILPFRTSSNIFSKKHIVHKNMLNSSLLFKSLSPISKEHDTFDPGSPWRTPQLPYVFSCGKHFVQSTPNENKTDIMHMKRITQIRDDLYNTDKAANNLSDMVSKNTNSSLQNLSDNKVSYKKNPNICRKFGTEITNTEYLNNCTTIQGNNVEVVSEKPVAETEINSVTNIQDKIASSTSNSHLLDDADDKENVAANYQTPKKSPRKKLKKRHLSNISPFKGYEIKNIAQSENMESQPGPSGMRTLKNLDEQKILHQSNLNNFLNLMDVPENTRISTKHGIFDDTHSSLISSSAIKKSTKPTIGELEDAFGFCENVTELDILSTKNELTTNPASTKTQTTCSSKPVTTLVPSRLSLGELRNNLLPKKPDKSVDSFRTTKQQKVKVSKSEEKENPEEKKNSQFVNAINFSDTFDILSESERLSNCETNVPLFVDLEPSHFSMVFIISSFYLYSVYY